MNSSPCAKLTTSMMPKIRVSPEATSARIMPVTMPLIVWIRIWSMRSMSDAEIAVDDRVVDPQVGGPRVVPHLALLDEVDALAGFEGQRHVLLDQQHRHAVGVEGGDDLADLRDYARHQPFGRLVEQDDLGFEHHRPGDRQHLLFAAREGAAELVAPLGEAREKREQLVDQLGLARLRDAVPVEPGAQVR